MRKPFKLANSFNDLLFNVLSGFFLLLLIAIVMVNPKAKNKDISLKSDFLITMEWHQEDRNDIDLFVQLPDKNIVYYGNRNAPMASLDRDDRGAFNDSVELEDGTKVSIKENWEHVMIRKVIPGEYTVNVLFFRGDVIPLKKGDPMITRKDGSKYRKEKPANQPVEVTVKIERLRPYNKVVYYKKVVLDKIRDEKTIVRFRLDKKGKVVYKTEQFKSLVDQLGKRRK